MIDIEEEEENIQMARGTKESREKGGNQKVKRIEMEESKVNSCKLGGKKG